MDKFGRKIGMIFPAIGMTLQGIISIFIVTYNLNPYYFILANFVGGIVGGHTTLLASAFSYAADVTSLRWRTLRVGAIEAALALGSASGHFFIGYWLHEVDCDYMPPLYFFTGCCFAILFYVVFLLPESLNSAEREEMCSRNPKGVGAFIESCKLYCGRLSLASTWKLYTVTIIVCVVGFNMFGAMLVDVYFLKAIPFDFSSLHIGYYESLRAASQGLSNILVMPLFVVLLGVSDAWIMLVGMFFHIAGNMLIGFSIKGWQLYSGMKGCIYIQCNLR